MFRSKFDSASQAAKHYLGRAAAAGTALVASGAALAQSGPDTSAIESEFNTYKLAVVGLVIAFAVVLWAIRAAGLLKPRG